MTVPRARGTCVFRTFFSAAAFVLPAIRPRAGDSVSRTQPHHRININSWSHVPPSIAGIPLLKKGVPSTSALLGSSNNSRLQQRGQACWELCRLHNNIGFWVVWLPTAWSIAMAYHAHPELSARAALLRAAIYVPLCFGVKSLIMTIDDLLDRDIDARVERTKNRPLPRGAISPGRAWLFFGTQAALGVLRASMPVWPLYIIYPTCKRWTNLAPIPLGLMFNVGVFMGWGDLVAGPVPWRVLVPVYLGCALWTVTYETVYQHQDKIDDATIGIHSPALLCREHTLGVCTAAALGFLALLAYGGMLNNQGAPALLRTDIDVPGECKEFFLLTPRLGQIILGGFVADAVLHRVGEGVAFLRVSMPAWPLYILYPTCKRWTNLAPIPLGLMFNVGVFMGWGDLVAGPVPWRILVPVTRTNSTTRTLGIHSPALLCREHTRGVCTAAALGFLALLAYGGALNRQGAPFYAGVAGAGGMLLRALRRTDVDVPGECKTFFLRTPRVGQVVLGGFVADAGPA
ncbi:UbiA prenyltransferase family-domain-containing protein [Mycena olivaceomarginata]|nr:UbiA prenyltransferase family-domain-containing protein [Mycena olivaceomarginata]